MNCLFESISLYDKSTKLLHKREFAVLYRQLLRPLSQLARHLPHYDLAAVLDVLDASNPMVLPRRALLEFTRCIIDDSARFLTHIVSYSPADNWIRKFAGIIPPDFENSWSILPVHRR